MTTTDNSTDQATDPCDDATADQHDQTEHEQDDQPRLTSIGVVPAGVNLVRVKRRTPDGWSLMALQGPGAVDDVNYPVEQASDPEWIREQWGAGDYHLQWLQWDGKRIRAVGRSRTFTVKAPGAGGASNTPRKKPVDRAEEAAFVPDGGRPVDLSALGPLGAVVAQLLPLVPVLAPLLQAWRSLEDSRAARYRTDADLLIARERAAAEQSIAMMREHTQTLLTLAAKPSGGHEPVLAEIARLRDHVDTLATKVDELSEDDGEQLAVAESWQGVVREGVGKLPDVVGQAVELVKASKQS